MRNLLVAALIGTVTAGAVFAQTASPPAKSTTPPQATAKAPAPPKATADKPRTAESLECSKQADAKGLHGNARRSFRTKCKKELSKKS